MKCNFIQIKSKDKKNINLNNNQVLEFFKLSVGNSIYIKDYNKNKKESSDNNLEISYYKNYIKSNIGKMIYTGYNKKIKIFSEIFISNNKKRAKIILNNKQYELKENLEHQRQFIQIIKIKLFDYIFYSNCMFQNCKSLSSVKHFQNIKTNYLKEIYSLFEGCSSVEELPDISKWNTNKIINMSDLFCGCSKIKYLPDISNWNISNVKDISRMFSQCSLVEELPDISKWNTNKIINMSDLFCGCSKIKLLPDISNWNLSNVKDISKMFCECSLLNSLPNIS